MECAGRSGIGVLLVSSLGVGGYIGYPDIEKVAAANDSVLETVWRFPDKICGLCYVNPQHSDESLAEIDRCIAHGDMIGVKLWVAAKASDPGI